MLAEQLGGIVEEQEHLASRIQRFGRGAQHRRGFPAFGDGDQQVLCSVTEVQPFSDVLFEQFRLAPGLYGTGAETPAEGN